MGYLVTLGRARTITCKEIIEKFEQIALGESLLDLSLFKNRMTAIAAGKVAARKKDAELKVHSTLSIEQRAVQAGKEAAYAAGNINSVEDDELPKVVKERREEGATHIDEAALIDEVRPCTFCGIR